MDISDFIKAASDYNVLGIKVSKDNELAAEWYSEPECRRNIYSATKSFTSCAVGFAVQEGLIDLNEKLTEAFSGDLPECIDVWQAFLYKDAPAAIWFLTLHPDFFPNLE